MLRSKMNNWKTFVLSLLTAGLIALLAGCSSDSVPLMAPLTSSDLSAEFRYPEFTLETLDDALPAGYRVVPLPTTLDACDTARASAWCEWNKDKTINISHFIEFKYYKNLMSTSATITIVAPNRCVPVADFYPHPTQFRGNVQMKFKLHEMGYDRVVDLSTLVPFYYNEETGRYEEMTNWRFEGADYQCMFIWTDHFSRYIIGAPTN